MRSARPTSICLHRRHSSSLNRIWLVHVVLIFGALSLLQLHRACVIYLLFFLVAISFFYICLFLFNSNFVATVQKSGRRCVLWLKTHMQVLSQTWFCISFVCQILCYIIRHLFFFVSCFEWLNTVLWVGRIKLHVKLEFLQAHPSDSVFASVMCLFAVMIHSACKCCLTLVDAFIRLYLTCYVQHAFRICW